MKNYLPVGYESAKTDLYLNVSKLWHSKIIRMMKLVTVLMLAMCVHLSATNADAQLVTLHEQDSELSQVFLKIRKQTGFNFLFNTQILQLAHPVTVAIEKLPLDKALDAIFEEQPLTYSIIDRTIVIKVAAYKTETMNTLSSPVLEDYLLEQNHDYMAIVEGIVTDPSGEPLIGVNIQVKGTTRGSTTNFEGMYSIEAELQDT